MEDRTKNFINTVIFVSRIFSGLKDKFLARKLYDKLSDFVSVYAERRGDNVAQRGFGNINVAKSDHIVQHQDVAQYGQPDIKVATDSLLDLLDYLEHSKIVAATPLLYARRSLLSFKLQLMRMPVKTQAVKEEKKEPVSPSPKAKQEINLSGNKEKILNYIKRSPNSRTKDIIYEFGVLSERTVKRNLKELVSGGLVKRSSKDNAVYYSSK